MTLREKLDMAKQLRRESLNLYCRAMHPSFGGNTNAALAIGDQALKLRLQAEWLEDQVAEDRGW